MFSYAKTRVWETITCLFFFPGCKYTWEAWKDAGGKEKVRSQITRGFARLTGWNFVYIASDEPERTRRSLFSWNRRRKKGRKEQLGLGDWVPIQKTRMEGCGMWPFLVGKGTAKNT